MKALSGAWQEELVACSAVFNFFLLISPGLVRIWGFFCLNSDPKDKSMISTSVGPEFLGETVGGAGGSLKARTVR